MENPKDIKPVVEVDEKLTPAEVALNLGIHKAGVFKDESNDGLTREQSVKIIADRVDLLQGRLSGKNKPA